MSAGLGFQMLETFFTDYMLYWPCSFVGYYSAGRSALAHVGYAISPKSALLCCWKDFLASIITFTWRLLPVLLYCSGVESELRVNDSLKDSVLPEKLLVWLKVLKTAIQVSYLWLFLVCLFNVQTCTFLMKNVKSAKFRMQILINSVFAQEKMILLHFHLMVQVILAGCSLLTCKPSYLK